MKNLALILYLILKGWMFFSLRLGARQIVSLITFIQGVPGNSTKCNNIRQKE